jgi:hypothetical protein
VRVEVGSAGIKRYLSRVVVCERVEPINFAKKNAGQSPRKIRVNMPNFLPGPKVQLSLIKSWAESSHARESSSFSINFSVLSVPAAFCHAGRAYARYRGRVPNLAPLAD